MEFYWHIIVDAVLLSECIDIERRYIVFNCSLVFDARFSSILLSNSIQNLKWYAIDRCNRIMFTMSLNSLLVLFVMRIVQYTCFRCLVELFMAQAKWHHNNNNWNNPLFYYGDLCVANKTDKTNFIGKIVYWNLCANRASNKGKKNAKLNLHNYSSRFAFVVAVNMEKSYFHLSLVRAFDRYYFSILQQFRLYS